MISIAEAIAGIPAPQPKPERHRDRARRFYRSIAWQKARYAALAENAKRHGGVATCDLCGTTRQSGAILDIDHVVPLSVDWSKRLDPANHQVLCRPCNFGKSNRTSDDWRSASEAAA